MLFTTTVKTIETGLNILRAKRCFLA